MDIQRGARDPVEHVSEVPLNPGSSWSLTALPALAAPRPLQVGRPIIVEKTVCASRDGDYAGEVASVILQGFREANMGVRGFGTVASEATLFVDSRDAGIPSRGPDLRCC